MTASVEHSTIWDHTTFKHHLNLFGTVAQIWSQDFKICNGRSLALGHRWNTWGKKNFRPGCLLREVPMEKNWHEHLIFCGREYSYREPM